MDFNKVAGIISIIIGLLFIAFPMLSSTVISIIIGIGLVLLGISAFTTSFAMRKGSHRIFSIMGVFIALVLLILGLLFIFYVDIVSFLVGVQFYLIGFILILFALSGLISRPNKKSTAISVLILILGIVSIALAAFSIAEPAIIATIIGAVLIIEGVFLIIMD